eukprot:Em0017g706a
MFVLKERLLYYRATDAVNEICLKRGIANAKERTNIIHVAMVALMVATRAGTRRELRSDKHTGGKDLTEIQSSTADDAMYVSGSMQKLRGRKLNFTPFQFQAKYAWSQIGIDLIVFCRYGWPDIIISDQGRDFVNQLSSCLFKLTGIEHRISSPYHPQTKAKQDSSQFSPFFIMYNRNPRIAIDHEFSCKATTNVTASAGGNGYYGGPYNSRGYGKMRSYNAPTKWDSSNRWHAPSGKNRGYIRY